MFDRLHRTIAPLALAGVLATAPAEAGVRYELEGTEHTRGKERPFTTEVVIEGDRVRVAHQLEGDTAGEIIYRGDRGELLIIDHGSKSYVVVDDELAGNLTSMIEDGMSEVLAQVPEAQRAEIEKMMKQQLGAGSEASAPEVEIRNTREKAEMHGYACVKHQILQGGSLAREHCVAPWEKIEGGRESVAAFQSMSTFYRELLDSIREVGVPMDEDLDNPFDHLNEMGGFPVSTREFDAGGDLANEWRLVSSEKRTFEPAEFEAPSGYSREEMSDN